MNQYAVVSGPVTDRKEIVGTGSAIRTQVVELAYATQLNARLRELAQEGITEVEVDWQAVDGGHRIVGCLRWDEGSSGKTLTVKEVSAKTGVPTRTLTDLIRRGELPASRTGRKYRVPAQAAERVLAGYR